MELKLTEEELKEFRSKNSRFIESQGELSHITSMIDRYEKKKLSSLLNYEMSLSQLEQFQDDMNSKYNKDGKEGFRVDFKDGSVKFIK